jgi:signal recognition particle GTPase
MAHVLITGMTESGKTTLARELAAQYRAQGIAVIVLDPIRDIKWTQCADFVTDISEEFVYTVENSKSCAVFVDEAGEAVGQYSKEMFFLGTRARHLGHRSHFIVQRPNQISPTVRDQCTHLYLFAMYKKTCKLLAEDWNKDQLLEGSDLEKGEYIYAPKFGECRQDRIF